MLLTKTLIKFNNILVKIPNQTKRIWDLSENRWGYKFFSKKKNNYFIKYVKLNLLFFTYLIYSDYDWNKKIKFS